MRKTLITLLSLSLLLAGCSWGIKLNRQGKQIRTDWNGNMQVCQRLGKVTVSVADQLGPFERNDIKVRDELEVMARNQAGSMTGADTVHPLTDPVAGSQIWGVYQCKGADTKGADTGVPAAAASSDGVQTFPLDGDGG